MGSSGRMATADSRCVFFGRDGACTLRRCTVEREVSMEEQCFPARCEPGQ